MSGKPHCQNHEDTHADEKPDHSVKTVSSQKEDPGQEQSPSWEVNMALPPSGDEESGSNKKIHKRMVHNAVERRRKVKITNHIHILAKLLPNKDGKRWSKNETLEKAVEYIHEIKNAHDKMMMGKLDEAHAAELTRMKHRIDELEQQNSTYAKLLEIAGIPSKGDCNAASWDPNNLGQKINSEMISLKSNKEIVIIDDDEECCAANAKLTNFKCKNVNGKQGNKDCKVESSTKEMTSTSVSTASVGEMNKQRSETGTLNSLASFPSGQTVHQKNGVILLPPPCTSSEQLFMSFNQVGTSNTKSTTHQSLESSDGIKPSDHATASSCVQPSQSVTLTKSTESSTAVQAIQESVITNSGVNGSVTAVTRSLSSAPIMSTNQMSSNMQQHQTVVPQMPVLNIGGTMNLMQGPMHQLITINDQGMPMLQMVAGPPQMGSGQVIVNGTSTQNLLVMGNASASVPTTMHSNMNSVGMNPQTFHVTGHPAVPANGMQLDCQSGHSQNFVQTDAALFHQTLCGNQLMGQTQCLPNLAGAIQQLQSANSSNPQLQLMTSSMNAQMNPHMISAQNGGVVLGPTMQGPQQQQHNHNNALLTVNSTTNSSNLPSALMLPNGQIIPVVREPSLMYQNSASIGGNLLMNAAPSSVPHTVFSSNQSCQTQTSLSTTLATLAGRPLTASGEFTPGSNCSAPVGSTTQSLNMSRPMADGQLHSLIGQVTGGQAVMSNRSLAPSVALPSRSRSNGTVGEPSLSTTSSTSVTTRDVAAMQGKVLDTVSSTCPTTTPVSSGAKPAQHTSKKSKLTTKRAQRSIKPKPTQATPSAPSTSPSSTRSTSTPLAGMPSMLAASCKDPSSVIPGNSSAATESVNFSTHFSAASNLSSKDKPPASSSDYLSNTSLSDTVTSTTTKSSNKKQANSRPSNIMNDILAQATESIFSNSISDISSSPNPHYFGNSGSNSNSSHAIFMQDVANDVEKKDRAQSSFTAALIMDASKSIDSLTNASNDSEHGGGEMMDVSSESLQTDKSQQHRADMLSNLVGEVYKTTNNESSAAPSLVSVTTSNIPTTCSTFDSDFCLRNTSSAMLNPSMKENGCTNTCTDGNSLGPTTASSDLGLSFTVSSNSGHPSQSNNQNINSSPNGTCGTAEKEKRSCTDGLPNSKRSRPSCLSLDCSPIEGDGVLKEIGAASKSGPGEVPSVVPTQPADSSITPAASNSVNFVSISQLASSASNIATTTTSSLGTFANSVLPNVAPFSIDTGISNENSPLCSISPLLSSPNKSSDLAFTLSSAISDLPRSDDSPFLAKSSSGGGNYAGITSDGNSLASTSSPFTNVPHSFSSATSLSLTSASTFCMPELGNNSVATSNNHSGFGSMSYSGPAAMQRSNFNGISTLRHAVPSPPMSASSTITASTSFLDKSHKLHPLHYNSRQSEMRVQGHVLPPASSHNHQSQISSRHLPNAIDVVADHHNTPSGNNLNFATTHLPLQIAPFSQAYSMPLSHNSALQSPRAPVSNVNISHNDASKAKSNSQRRPSINSMDGGPQNGIISPLGMSPAHMQRPGSMHQLRPILDSMIPGLGPPQIRQSQNYQPQRMHVLNRQSPQGGATAPSPKMPEVHGHSPINNRGPTSATRHNGNASPKPNLPIVRNHPVPSPGRNPLPTTPVSSPATFLPRRSPNVSAVEGPMITSYAIENSIQQNPSHDLNFHPGQKQLTHLPVVSSMNTTSRAIISYSAESLIQSQPNSRPNCAREGHVVPASGSGRQAVLGPNGHGGNNPVPCATSNALQFGQVAGNRPAGEDIHHAGFPYFAPFQQHLTTDQMVSHQMALPPPPPPHSGNALKHAPVQNHAAINKTCVMRGTLESSQAIQSQPNFSFSLLQHSQTGAEVHHHHHHQQQQQQQQQLLQAHQQQGADQEVGSNAMRHHNGYLSMGSYGGQGPTAGVMPMPTGLQGQAHKDAQLSKPPMAFPCIPPFPHNQTSIGQAPNVRQAANNSFLPQNGINGMNFPEMYATQNNLRPEGINVGGPPVGGGNVTGTQGTEKAGSAPFKSRNASNSKQDGATATKSSKSKQQSKKKHHQYSVEEVNLSNSIFETGRSMTPYFAIPNLSPPRNEVPTYIPNPNPLFNTPQRALAPNASQQPKATDLGTPYGPLFTPRTQSGLNLNFQATGFGGFGNGSMPNQMPSHGGGVNVASHVTNFNLSNIFPDINSSNEGISISPIKFHHGNHILPPPQPGMEHNLQHHHQSSSLYHKRGHHSPVIHNGMTINSLLGHNPHTFDGRPQVPMGINNTMTTPFHGHGHTPSFSNVIPTLPFPMHDH